MRKTPAFVALAIVSIAVRSFASASESLPSASDSLFPELTGYTLVHEARVYEPQDLWDFIDGAADLFVSYGFVNLHIAYYRAGEGREFRVEVYRHDSAENAFGMYSQERAPENQYLSVGVQGYAEEGILNFLAGPFYVKISANRTGEVVAQELEKIARALADGLAQPRDWPAALALLPEEGRVKYSEQYIAESYLGYTFLKGAYVAKYTLGRSFELFVVPAASAGAAAHAASMLCDINHVPPGGERIRMFEDAHHGAMTILVSGRYLAGVVHCADPETRARYIEILQTSLR